MIDEMAESDARPGRRRHRRRRHDGGIGGQGAVREADARGRHVRPPRLPAGDPGHHQAGREGRQGAVGLPAARQVQVRRQGQGAGRSRPAQGLRHAREAEAPRAGRGRQRQGQEGAAAADADADEQVLLGSVFKGLEQDVVRGDIIQTEQAHRRPRPEDGAADPLGGARAAAHARLGAVHARRDAGAGGRHARHRRGRAVHRRAGGHAQGALPAALQLPALLGRRDGPHGLARPPRDRPRQARLARRASADAERRRSSPTRSAWSPRSPNPTAPRRWRPCAAPRWR